jgi:hypothetical protein
MTSAVTLSSCRVLRVQRRDMHVVDVFAGGLVAVDVFADVCRPFALVLETWLSTKGDEADLVALAKGAG